MMGTESERGLLLAVPARDRDDLAAHLGGKLHGEMTQAAYADDGYPLAGLHAGAAKGIEGGDARAHERADIGQVQARRDLRQRTGRGDQVLRVAAMPHEPEGLHVLAGHEVTPAAGRAGTALTAEPAHPDLGLQLPAFYPGADRVDHAADLMAWGERVRNPGRSG